MAFISVTEKQALNGGPYNVLQPPQRIILDSERAMLMFYKQSGWSAKPKAWFSPRYSAPGTDGMIDFCQGWLRGLDGQPQFLRRHPLAAGAQLMKRLAVNDGRFGFSSTTQAYPVVTAATMGTLLSSSNSVIPPVAADGSAKMTCAMIIHQPAANGGYFISGDGLADAASKMAIGQPAGDGAIRAYSLYDSTIGSARQATTNTAANPGTKMLLAVEFPGDAVPNIWINGTLATIAGSPTPAGGAVESQRFRLGSLQAAAGASFVTQADGYIEDVLFFPDVDPSGASKPIKDHLRALALGYHPDMTIAA